jgi:hypothetical protein
MSPKTKFAATAAVIAGAAAGAATTAAWSDDPAPAANGGDVHQKIVRPALEPAQAARAAARKKAKKPKVTHLITSSPITVPANEEIVAEMTCKRSQGIPLSGGAIAPPAPAEVAVHVLSRFNPNPPYDGRPQNYYVGVRNLADAPAEFRATLTCAKGISE